MNYKSYNTTNELPINDNLETNLTIPKIYHESENIDKKFSNLNTLFRLLDSNPNKTIVLEKIRGEIFSLSKNNYELLPAFSQGHILGRFLEILQLDNFAYSRIIITIFQMLLNNSSEFASFIKLHESDFFRLIPCPDLFFDLLNLFSIVVMAIPDFAFDLHSNNLINLLYSTLNTLQAEVEIPNIPTIEKLRSISNIIEVMIQKKVLYDTTSSNSTIQEQLIFIAQFFLTIENPVKVKSLEKRPKLFTKAPKIQSENKEIEKNLLTIYRQGLQLVHYLLSDVNLPITLLFDEWLRERLYKGVCKGIFIHEISDGLLLFARNYPWDSFSFFSYNDYQFLMRFLRQGKSHDYEWIIIEAIMALIDSSQSLADVIYEQEYLQHFEPEMDSIPRKKKEIVFTLFCKFGLQIPQKIAAHDSITLYLDECVNLCAFCCDAFKVLFFSTVFKLMDFHIEPFYSFLAESNFLQELEEISNESNDPQINDLSKKIMEKYDV